MQLAFIDWIIIIAYVSFAIIVGILVSKKAGANINEYFVAGHKLPWWIAGTSIVATSFAIDTPLLVSGWARSDGVWRNWTWWTFAITTLLGVFLFAKLWRRGKVITKAEVVELRYGGNGAKFLRGFLGLIHAGVTNTIVMAWVLLAFMKISTVLLGISEFWAAVIACIIALVYSLLGGFWGVVLTDLVQFAMATIGAIWFATIVWFEVGALSDPQISNSIPQALMEFFPSPGEGANFFESAFWTTPLVIICVNLGVGWYASEAADGSNLAVQRISAAKTERDGTLAMLWYGITNYALRPWAWIVVGLLSLLVFQHLEVKAPQAGVIKSVDNKTVVIQTLDKQSLEVPLDHPSSTDLWKPDQTKVKVGSEVKTGDVLSTTDHEKAYPAMMAKFLPVGVLGLVIASLLAAFMSTIDTHVNLASSFFTNDLYRRFIRPKESDKHYVLVARLASVGVLILAAIVASMIDTVAGVFLFFLSFLGGVGPVYAMRWLWWRVKVGCEIAAMLVSAISTVLLTFVFSGEGDWFKWFDTPLSPDGVLVPEGRLLIVVLLSTLSALLIIIFGKKNEPNDLVGFYKKFRPPGFWKPVQELIPESEKQSNHLLLIIYGILSGLGLIWGLMLGIGYVLVGNMFATWLCAAFVAIGGIGVAIVLSKQEN